MPRNPFGWSLPPGCTQRHIDEAFGDDVDPEAPLTLWHCSACGQDNVYPDDIRCTQCHKEWDDSDELTTEDNDNA